MRFAVILSTVVAVALLATSTALATSSTVSWYGPGLYGNHLACGGVLTTRTWGVAHKWLPCGTHIRMCFRRCVTVTVVDRGPFVAGRDFDLTYPVMRAIGMTGGVATVRWFRR